MNLEKFLVFINQYFKSNWLRARLRCTKKDLITIPVERPESYQIINEIYSFMFHKEFDFDSIELIDDKNCFFIMIKKIKNDCYNLYFKHENVVINELSKEFFRRELYLLDEKNPKCLKINLPILGIVKPVAEDPKTSHTQS